MNSLDPAGSAVELGKLMPEIDKALAKQDWNALSGLARVVQSRAKSLEDQADRMSASHPAVLVGPLLAKVGEQVWLKFPAGSEIRMPGQTIIVDADSQLPVSVS